MYTRILNNTLDIWFSVVCVQKTDLFDVQRLYTIYTYVLKSDYFSKIKGFYVLFESVIFSPVIEQQTVLYFSIWHNYILSVYIFNIHCIS